MVCCIVHAPNTLYLALKGFEFSNHVMSELLLPFHSPSNLIAIACMYQPVSAENDKTEKECLGFEQLAFQQTPAKA